MKKIKIPNWKLMTGPYSDIISPSLLTAWFYKNIEGKYLVDESDLVEFTGYKEGDQWLMGSDSYKRDTHKCMVIKSSIEPINSEPKLVRKCPKCGKGNILTERRIGGDSSCGNCQYKNKTKYFDSYVM